MLVVDFQVSATESTSTSAIASATVPTAASTNVSTTVFAIEVGEDKM